MFKSIHTKNQHIKCKIHKFHPGLLMIYSMTPKYIYKGNSQSIGEIYNNSYNKFCSQHA